MCYVYSLCSMFERMLSQSQCLAQLIPSDLAVLAPVWEPCRQAGREAVLDASSVSQPVKLVSHHTI